MLPLFLQPALVAHSLSLSPFLPVSFHLNVCLPPRFPIITSHLWGPLLRRASHLSPRCDNRYRWHSTPGLSPINTCSPLSLFLAFLFTIFPPPFFPSLPPSSFSIVIALICDVQPVVCPVPLPFCLLCPLLYQVTGCPYAVISLSISMPPGDGTVIPSWFEPVHVAPACIHYCIWCQQLVSKWVLLSAFDSSHHFLLARHQSRD